MNLFWQLIAASWQVICWRCIATSINHFTQNGLSKTLSALNDSVFVDFSRVFVVGGRNPLALSELKDVCKQELVICELVVIQFADKFVSVATCINLQIIT